MSDAEALVAAARIEDISHALYAPAGDPDRAAGVIARLSSSGRWLWQRAAWLQPWKVVVELGSGLGEMIVAVPLPPGSRLVAVVSSPADITLLRRTIGEFDRPVEVVDVSSSTDSSVLSRVGAAASMATRSDHADSVCFRIGWPLEADEVMRQLDTVLSSFTRWAVVANVASLGSQRIAELARTRFVFLMDRRTHRLVRVSSGLSPAAVLRMLKAGWLYPDEVAILSSPDLAGTW